MSIFGTRPSPADGLPADAPRGREAERILAGELLAALRSWQQTMTQFIARLTGRLTNNVLESGTRIFDTTGVMGLKWGTPCGAIEVSNVSTHPITIAGGATNTTVAPTSGVGVHIVPAGAVRLINIDAREATLWGTSGDQVCLQAFAWGGVAQSGLIGVDGGMA